MANTVALTTATATAGSNATAELLLLRQFAITARSIHGAASAAGDERRAEQLNGALRDRLRQVRDTCRTTERAHAVAQLTPEQRATAARAELSQAHTGPLPTPLTPRTDVPSTTRRTGVGKRREGFER